MKTKLSKIFWIIRFYCIYCILKIRGKLYPSLYEKDIMLTKYGLSIKKASKRRIVNAQQKVSSKIIMPPGTRYTRPHYQAKKDCAKKIGKSGRIIKEVKRISK